MTRWTYDPAICAADIDLVPGGQYIARPVRTVDLEGAHVLLDVDRDGKVVSIEILGPARDFDLAHLGRYLKEEANGAEKGADSQH